VPVARAVLCTPVVLSGAHGVRALPELFVVPPVVIFEWVTVTDKFHNAMIAPFIDSGAWL